MYALFLSSNNFITGYKETTQEESETFEIKFVLVNSLPIELSNWQENTMLKWDEETESVTVIAQPPRPKTEIELLREENADLNLQMINLWESLISAGVL